MKDRKKLYRFNTQSKFDVVKRMIEGNGWVLNLYGYIESLKNEALMYSNYELAAKCRKLQLSLNEKI
jgi:hypothetical protein